MSPQEPIVEGSETPAADTTLDRATAMEDCSRLALEAEQSLPIAQTVGEALAVLSSALSVASSLTTPQVMTTVSSEVASAVVEAEEYVDDLLRVIQVSSHHGAGALSDESPFYVLVMVRAFCWLTLTDYSPVFRCSVFHPPNTVMVAG